MWVYDVANSFLKVVGYEPEVSILTRESVGWRFSTFSSLVSGNPPSDFLSHNVCDSTFDASGDGDDLVVSNVMVKTPPVEGLRATSPREVENVWRSSCAYC